MVEILAILLSPIIALVISEKMRKKNYNQEKRLEIIYKLMAYRNRVDNSKFLSALNSIKLFYKDLVVRKKVDELHYILKNNKSREKRDEKIAELIEAVCKSEGFRVSKKDVKNLFRKSEDRSRK